MATAEALGTGTGGQLSRLARVKTRPTANPRDLLVSVNDDEMGWRALAGVAASIGLGWLLFVALLVRVKPDRDELREALRLLPDTLRLVSRLARDRSLSRSIRVRLWLLLAYLALPIDLVPDFVPVLGYADDAILVAWTLRAVVRRADVDALRRHWPGTPHGLASLRRLGGLG